MTQEQHSERCQLFAQWKQFDWPILHDPLNVLGSKAVPIVLAIDEYGIVRSTDPNPQTLVAEFLSRSFLDDATNRPARRAPIRPEELDRTVAAGPDSETAAGWCLFGDRVALWGGEARLPAAIAAYRAAVSLDPNNGAAWFRLGVCLRRRSETRFREAHDFQEAVAAWGTALDIDPDQYIWRRRIEQYGPRLHKPYPFYDWVPDAEAAIRDRGQTPVVLSVRPDGAEIATPTKSFQAAPADARNPDPLGKITRDTGAVTCEAVVVPSIVNPGQSARVHLTFRLAAMSTAHWNHEWDPLRVWVDAPDGVEVSERSVAAEQPRRATSVEDQTVGFEVRIPENARGVLRLPAYAVYALCDESGGHCRFVRLDLDVQIRVRSP